MPDATPLKKAWEMLDARERRNALGVLVIAMLSALASTAMVGSVMPFLTVLSNPASIHENPALAWVYYGLGFTSSYTFLTALGLGALSVIGLPPHRNEIS